LHRPHLLCSAGPAGSWRPHPAQAHNFGEAIAEGSASAVVAAASAAPGLAELPRVVVGPAAPEVEALASALLPAARLATGTPTAAGCAGASPPAPGSLAAAAVSAVVAVHAEHSRAAAGFFFCVMVNEPGGLQLSVPHAAHRMAGGRSGAGAGR